MHCRVRTCGIHMTNLVPCSISQYRHAVSFASIIHPISPVFVTIWINNITIPVIFSFFKLSLKLFTCQVIHNLESHFETLLTENIFNMNHRPHTGHHPSIDIHLFLHVYYSPNHHCSYYHLHSIDNLFHAVFHL